MEIYAPLADRMGMNRIRDELEDLSFGVLNVKAKKMIKDRLDDIKEKNLLMSLKIYQKIFKIF